MLTPTVACGTRLPRLLDHLLSLGHPGLDQVSHRHDLQPFDSEQIAEQTGTTPADADHADTHDVDGIAGQTTVVTAGSIFCAHDVSSAHRGRGTECCT